MRGPAAKARTAGPRYPAATLQAAPIAKEPAPDAPERERLEATGPFRLVRRLGEGGFAPVYVSDTLTVDFHTREVSASNHYAFSVSDAEFDAIFGRIKAAGIPYRSRPRGENDGQINTRLGGKNLYWEDADGHLWEMLTISYARPESPALTPAG